MDTKFWIQRVFFFVLDWSAPKAEEPIAEREVIDLWHSKEYLHKSECVPGIIDSGLEEKFVIRVQIPVRYITSTDTWEENNAIA